MENKKDSNDISIDFKRLFLVLVEHSKFIIIITLLFTIAALALAQEVSAKKYVSTSQLYVDMKSENSDQTQVLASDLAMAEKIASSSLVLFNGDKMAELVKKDLERDFEVIGYSTDTIKSMISAEVSADGASYINIRVTSSDAELSAYIANIVSKRAKDVYRSAYASGTIDVVNHAKIPGGSATLSYKKNAMLGFLAGLALSCAFVVFMDFILKRVKKQDDLTKIYNIPVIGEILDYDVNVKRGI